VDNNTEKETQLVLDQVKEASVLKKEP
jgi:hypothetical protein